MPTNKQPEDWEASEHIENLKLGVTMPGETPKQGICSYHSSLALALIWLIRHTDRQEKRDSRVDDADAKINAKIDVNSWPATLLAIARQSPVCLLAIALMFAVYVFARIHNIDIVP